MRKLFGIEKIESFYDPDVELPIYRQHVYTEKSRNFPSYNNFKFYIETFQQENNSLPNYFILNKFYLYAIRGWIKEWEFIKKSKSHYATIINTEIHGVDWIDKKHLILANLEFKMEFINLYEIQFND